MQKLLARFDEVEPSPGRAARAAGWPVSRPQGQPSVGGEQGKPCTRPARNSLTPVLRRRSVFLAELCRTRTSEGAAQRCAPRFGQPSNAPGRQRFAPDTATIVDFGCGTVRKLRRMYDSRDLIG